MKQYGLISALPLVGRWWLCGAGGALLAACASAPPEGRADLLDFVQVGNTSRTEVQRHLGEPNATYEGDRILAYRLARDAGGYVLVKGKGPVDWRVVKYNLMLAFDAQGVLQRHALVEVNEP